MAARATGRSRTLTAVVSHNRGYEWRNVVFDNKEALGTVFGCGISVSPAVVCAYWENDSSHSDPNTCRQRRRYYCSIDVTITYPGGSDGFTLTGPAVYGEWRTIAKPNPSYTCPLTIVGGNGCASGLAGSSSGKMTVTLTVDEYIDPTAATPVFEKVSAVAWEWEASGSSVSEDTFDGPISVEVTGSGSGSAAVDVTVPLSYYTHAVSLLCYAGESVSAEATLTGSGLSYTDSTIFLSDANGSLSGTTNNPTITGSASGSTQGSPDWSISMDLRDYDYEDGSALSVDHYFKSFSIAGNASSSSFSGNGATTLTNYAKGVYNGQTQEKGNMLFGLGTIRANAALACMVDEDWADNYGVLLNSINFSAGGISDRANNKHYRAHIESAFDVATIQFDSEHDFGLFDDVADWGGAESDIFGSIGMEDGYLKITSSSNIYAKTAPTIKGYAYRYFRVRMKGDKAGNVVWFALSKDGVTYRWFLTVGEANVWEEHILDFAYPDQIIATEFGPDLTIRNRDPFVNHPATWDSAGYGFSVNPRNAGSYWFDTFIGYYDTSANTIPVLLIGPMCCRADEAAEDAYDSLTSSENFNQLGKPGGGLVARVIVNGVHGFDLRVNATPNTTVAQAWATFFNTYDNAANNTGVHITYQDNTDTQEAYHVEGYEVTAAPLWRSVALDTPYTIRGQKRANIYGYYGMGTLGGEYGPTISLVADKVWNGEVWGQVFLTGSLPNQRVQLCEQETGAVVATARSNADGMYRLFYKYGVPRTYDNRGNTLFTRTGTAAYNYVYTYSGIGNNFNYFIIKRAELKRVSNDFWCFRDSPNYRRITILDRFAYNYDLWSDPSTGVVGIDLEQTENLWLFRSKVNSSDAIQVERSLDAGATWEEVVTVAADGSDGLSIPTLVRDRWDNLLCLYHNSTASYFYRSEDYGETWELVASASGSYPRATRQVFRIVIAIHDGTNIRFYETVDHGSTLTELTGLAFACPEQLVALRTDRHGILHVVYTTADGAVEHRHALTDSEWEDPVVIAVAGESPTYALGVRHGILLWWNNTLNVVFTDETYNDIREVLTTPTGFDQGYIGTLINHREEPYISGWNSTDITTKYTTDDGATWDTPT